MERKKEIGRRTAITGVALGGLGVLTVLYGPDLVERYLLTSPVQAAVPPDTVDITSSGVEVQPEAGVVIKDQESGTSPIKDQQAVVEKSQFVQESVVAEPNIGTEIIDSRQRLRDKYALVLEQDRLELNLFSRIDANVVILPLENPELSVDLNGSELAPGASLIKVLALLHGVFAKPQENQTFPEGSNAFEMMVNSHNLETAWYIAEQSQNPDRALDEINTFLWQAVGLEKYIGITNWNFEGGPRLLCHEQPERKYVYDQRLIGIDNPITLTEMAKALSVFESEERVKQVAQKAWDMGYGKDQYDSFANYQKEVLKAVAAAKELMALQSQDPNAKTMVTKAIESSTDLLAGMTLTDYGKSGTIGNNVKGWERGRYVNEVRCLTLEKAGKKETFILAYSAWSFKTEKFLQDCLAYMVEMTNAGK